MQITGSAQGGWGRKDAVSFARGYLVSHIKDTNLKDALLPTQIDKHNNTGLPKVLAGPSFGA